MPVATASREAYGRMRSVPPKEHPVYKFLRVLGTQTEGFSNRQIAQAMKRPINTITPRIFELRQAGVVVLAGKRKDLYSGVTVSHWRIATPVEESVSKGEKCPICGDTAEWCGFFADSLASVNVLYAPFGKV